MSKNPKASVVSFLLIYCIMCAKTTAAGTYIGFSFGHTSHDLNNYDAPQSGELYIGTNIYKYLDIEVSRIDLGHANNKLNDTTFIAALSNTAAAKINYNISGSFKLHVKTGLHFWDYSINNSGFTSSNESGTNLFYGVGISVKISKASELGYKYTAYDFDDNDIITNSSINYTYNY